MASNSLHLTTMCLQYRPTVVACFCIHLASKWSNWAIPQSNEGRHWFSYVDRSVTVELLERLTSEFLVIFEKCPSRLKRKMMNVRAADGSSPHSNAAHSSQAMPTTSKHPAPPSSDDFDKAFDKEYERERTRVRQPVPGGYVPATTAQPLPQPPLQKIDYNLYREKREREERERREEREKLRQAAIQQRHATPGQPQPRPSQAPPHHQRPGQHHHSKPHHSWTAHKPHHQKLPHDHRHHRPPSASTSQPHPPQPQPQQQPPPQPSSQPQPEAVPQRTRPPSLFSPENATTPTAAAQAAPRRPPQPQPPHRPKEVRPPQPTPATQEQRPPSPKKRPDATAAIREMQPPAILSPFNSPPSIKEPPKQRQRQQSNSEPELIPVVKKLDETPGYENIIKESQRVPSKPNKAERKEAPPSRSLNGIETDPTLVSNLLKESLAKPVPITVPVEKKSPIEIKKEVVEPPPQPPPVQPATSQPEPPSQPTEETEHKHKKEKKKKEKHKHKDRDKSKEERKKHKKDKDREKKREEKVEPPPPQVDPQTQDGTLRITIPREKLSTSPGLKIKIPKERLAAPPPPPQSSGLKIKISKEVLETSRKRTGAPEHGPPQKMPRQNGAPHQKVETPMGNGHSGK